MAQNGRSAKKIMWVLQIRKMNVANAVAIAAFIVVIVVTVVFLIVVDAVVAAVVIAVVIATVALFRPHFRLGVYDRMSVVYVVATNVHVKK